ncbi:MAG: hypothetical protein J6Q78_04330 [Clostridia bacterium]|nr:hypothetical protein [Clostridia bacterium]
MNNRPGRPKYRKNIYKKRRLKTVIITSVVLLVVVFLAFLIIGNILNDKVNGDGEVTDTPTDEKNSAEKKHSMLDIRSHYAVPSTAYSALRDVRSKDGNSVGVALTDSAGNPLYRSSVATSLGVDYTSTANLSDISSAAGSFNTHVCGIIYCNIFTSNDKNFRAAKLGYFAALASEALDKGLDKVLITVHDATEENIPELIAMARELQRLGVADDIGFSLPASFYTSEDHEYNIELIWNEVDFLGVDLTSLDGPIQESLLPEEISNVCFYMLSHKVIALIPENDEDILPVLKHHGAENYQYIG